MPVDVTSRIMRFFPLGAAALALISLACVAFPLYVIRPFRHQGSTELAAALLVKQIGPWVAICCIVLACVLTLLTWSRIRGWAPRSFMILTVGLTVAGACLSRLNVYELMFHPIGEPRFQSSQTARIDKDDMVIAVRLGAVSRAYPIREMAYHHIVNDTVGSEPIVATY
jgi:Protein of unknown function (DUF3179)